MWPCSDCGRTWAVVPCGGQALLYCHECDQWLDVTWENPAWMWWLEDELDRDLMAEAERDRTAGLGVPIEDVFRA